MEGLNPRIFSGYERYGDFFCIYNNEMKRIKILSVVIGVVIFLVSFLGMVQYPISKSVNSSISLIKVTMGGPARTISLFSNYIMKITDIDMVQKPGVPVSSKDTANQTKKLFKILFLTLNSILLMNEKILMILGAIFIGILHFAKLSDGRGKSVMIFHKVKNYIRWSLKFITPIQKCVSALVDRYDINHIYIMNIIAKVYSPRIFRMLKVRGFFLYT